MNSDPPPMPQLPGQPTPPPMFGQNQQQKKPKAKSMQPTFLGSGSVPTSGQQGQKTLVGQ